MVCMFEGDVAAVHSSGYEQCAMYHAPLAFAAWMCKLILGARIALDSAVDALAEMLSTTLVWGTWVGLWAFLSPMCIPSPPVPVHTWPLRACTKVPSFRPLLLCFLLFSDLDFFLALACAFVRLESLLLLLCDGRRREQLNTA
jgi:hypothetical protein